MKVTVGQQTLDVSVVQQTLDVSVVNQPSQVKVCLVDTIEIPQCSEAILQKSISRLKGEVLIGPKHEISCCNILYPVRSIADISNGIVLVRIVNTKSCIVKIFAERHLGMAEVLEGEEVKHIKEGKSHDVTLISNSPLWLDNIDLTSSVLPESENSSLANLLIEYRYVFVTSDINHGRAHCFTHKIETCENVPFHQRPHRLP